MKESVIIIFYLQFTKLLKIIGLLRVARFLDPKTARSETKTAKKPLEGFEKPLDLAVFQKIATFFNF